MKFAPLFNLFLTHLYYADQRCVDFSIEPDAATHKLLSDHRCTLINTANGIQVLTAVTDTGEPFIAMSENVKFCFQLRLKNPDFPLFTDLTEISKCQVPLFTNANSISANTVNLDHSCQRAWLSETFSVTKPAQAEPFTLKGNPLKGLQATDFEISGLGSETNPTQYDQAGKVISVNTKGASKGDVFEVRYETNPRKDRSVFAQVEIYNNASIPNIAVGPAEFQIAFKSKKVRWQYYLVADKDNVEFSINDAGDTPIVFDEVNRRDLNQNPDPADRIAVSLAGQYPEMKRIRFGSDKLISCQQQPRKSMHLFMGQDQVLDALPNPALRNFSSLEINRNGGMEKEDTLFQVIKYFTQKN